jgi:hypothetical protein
MVFMATAMPSRGKKEYIKERVDIIVAGNFGYIQIIKVTKIV